MRQRTATARTAPLVVTIDPPPDLAELAETDSSLGYDDMQPYVEDVVLVDPEDEITRPYHLCLVTALP